MTVIYLKHDGGLDWEETDLGDLKLLILDAKKFDALCELQEEFDEDGIAQSKEISYPGFTVRFVFENLDD